MAKKDTKAEVSTDQDTLIILSDHYTKGKQDMDTRRTRKNGWNETINAYMGKLPTNWPYTSMVTDPRIRTTILEKTARLLNAKLQGRLIPREGGDIVKARISNALLDYQWDYADTGGSMLEKIALCDQTARIFGAAFVLVYWDSKRNCNEIKVIDPRDIFIDPSANHIKNAKWVQVREFTTLDTLEERGYTNIDEIRKAIKNGDESDYYRSDLRSTEYESQVKVNRELEDRTGDDLANPVVELVTEYSKDYCRAFLPKYNNVVKDDKNPYSHKRINVAMLRYYPLGDDIYGESEVEPVMPIQRAINSFLCGAIDELNITQRPPLKIVSTQVQMPTIEYGPGAKWLMNDVNAVQEAQLGAGVLQNFQGIYSTLVAAFETAMGGQSLGVSNIGPMQADKTATEVASLERQQTSRDQYNQLYLGEFLKDIMMMWTSNNKQYLFDDPTKHYHVLKIIGKDKIKEFQAMKLETMNIPEDAMKEIEDIVMTAGGQVSDEELYNITSEVAVPNTPVVTNPNDEPEEYNVKPKLDIKSPEEADLYVTKEDVDIEADYIPDVKSMSAGAGVMQQQARTEFMARILDPQVQALLNTQGEMVDIKELLVSDAENAGYKDAESLFRPAPTPDITGGPTSPGPGQIPAGVNGNGGVQALPPALPVQPSSGGIPQPQGLPIQ